jgi:hypothetical protein
MIKRKIVRRKDRLERIDNINRMSKDLIKEKEKKKEGHDCQIATLLFRMNVDTISTISQA